MTVLAHGTAGLAGEGIPVAAVHLIVVAATLITFLGLRARGPAPLGGPAVAAGTVDGAQSAPWPGDRAPAAVRVGGQALGAGLLLLALAVGWLGSDLPGASPLPIAMLTLTWWLAPALSLLGGDWYRLLDPFDALAGAVDRARSRPAPPPPATDEAGDWWVPAVLLASFAWLVTCWPDGLYPRTMALWLTGLTAVMLAGAVLGGRAWVRRSSPLAVLCGAVAAASPVSWETGRPRLRSPLRGLAGRAGGQRGLAALVVVLGATIWEATAGTVWWSEIAGTDDSPAATLWSTVGLAWAILLVALAWTLCARLTEHLAARAGGSGLVEPLAPDMALALGPLAVVTVLAHQLGLILVYVQDLVILSLDPFAQGWDLFGSFSWRIAEEPLSPGALGWTQLALVLGGLGLMLAGAWDRLVARVGAAATRAGWALAGWTALCGAITVWLLLGS